MRDNYDLPYSSIRCEHTGCPHSIHILAMFIRFLLRACSVTSLRLFLLMPSDAGRMTCILQEICAGQFQRVRTASLFFISQSIHPGEVVVNLLRTVREFLHRSEMEPAGVFGELRENRAANRANLNPSICTPISSPSSMLPHN